MKINNNILLLPFLLFLNLSYGQDIIWLKKKLKIIIKNWYPDFKNFLKLKIGKSKILFIEIPDFDKLSIPDNDINLLCTNDEIQISETEKTNQYLVTVNPTNQKSVEFEIWLALGNQTVLMLQNSQ